MAKYTVLPVANLENQVTAVATINTNLNRIATALENTLSRDGTAPNEMNADLDMNDHRIYNLPEPVADTEPLRKQDADEILSLVDEFQDVIDATEGVLEAYEDLQAIYLGNKTTLPIVDNLGQPLIEGALVSLVDQADPDDDGLYVYHNGSWGPVGVLPSAFERVEEIFTTAGQTVVAVPNGYTVGTSKIFRNGVLLKIGPNLGVGDTFDDVTASNGLDLVFPSSVLLLNDRITVLVSTPYAIATPPAALNVAFTPTGTVAATNVQSAIAEVASEAAQQTTTVTGGGIATGGGALSSNQVITVTKSSNAQALAGTDDTTAMTPLRVKDAITAAGATPAQVLITSGTTSSIATLDLALSGGWRKYLLMISDIEPGTANQALIARFSYDNGSTYPNGATEYRYAAKYSDDSGAEGMLSSTGNTAILLSRNQASSGYGSLLEMKIGVGTAGFPPVVNWTYGHTFNTGPTWSQLVGSARRNSTGIPTHIRLVFNSGNINANARYELYGLRN